MNIYICIYKMNNVEYIWNVPDVFRKCSRAGKRRTRLWILGEQNRGAIPDTDQCVQEWNWRAGDEAHTMVRPNWGFPQLFHSLEQSSDCVRKMNSFKRVPKIPNPNLKSGQINESIVLEQVLCGQSTNQGIQKCKLHKQFLPKWEANVLVLKHMERRRLGNKRRTWKDRLE